MSNTHTHTRLEQVRSSFPCGSHRQRWAVAAGSEHLQLAGRNKRLCRQWIDSADFSHVAINNNFEVSPINGIPLISLTYSLPVIQVGDR